MKDVDAWRTWLESASLKAAAELAAPVLIEGPGGFQAIIGGLSKREHYAAIAMEGLIARGYVDVNDTARGAVLFADALIAKLEDNANELKGLGSFAKGPA